MSLLYLKAEPVKKEKKEKKEKRESKGKKESKDTENKYPSDSELLETIKMVIRGT